jgi:predicted nucleic acid-binding protein
MIYVDTSALVKLYFPEPDSARIARLVAGSPIAFTRLHELEMTSALSQKLFVKSARPKQITETLASVADDVRAGVLVRAVPDWDVVLDDATHAARSHTPRLGTRSLDVLHCCAAKVLSAKAFITSDARQRTLATKLGLHAP